MPEASQWMNVRAPTFIRLLARLGEVDPPQREPSLSDRLSQWIDWTRAIALSNVLDARVQSMASAAPGAEHRDGEECIQARAALTRQIIDGSMALPAVLPAAEPSTDGAHVNVADAFKPLRQHYVQCQRAMLATTGQLRGRLRDRLAQRSPQMARLAEVDAVMELTLSPHEQALLGRVPDWLERHFERMRLASAAPDMEDRQTELMPQATIDTAHWLGSFRRDVQGVLLAELDVRFQPIEGLLAALQTE